MTDQNVSKSFADQRPGSKMILGKLVVKTIPAIILWAFLFLKFNPISFFGVCASLLGTIVLVKVSLALGLFVWEQWFMKQLDLVIRYGRDSWAVITGGSDGIGLAFAEKLAEAGINVVLVARNEEKLKEKVKKLTAAYKAKVQYRVADFSKGDSPEFYTELYKTMKDLDVSILVNNVGIGTGEHEFVDCDTKSCWDLGIVNMVPQFMMTKVFFNHFRARTTQSAVIDVSSITSLAEFVDCGLYGATKSFNRAFSQNMQEKFGAEYGIDFLVLKPGFVLSNFGDGVTSIKEKFKNTSDGFTVFTPEVCATSALKALGNVWETFGCHSLIGSVLNAGIWLTPAIQITQLCKILGLKK